MAWLEAPDSWLARFAIERGIGPISFVAFLVALRQFTPLLGARGLLPVPQFTAYVPFRTSPSLFHLRYSDRLLRASAWVGMGLSLLVVAGIPDGWPLGLELLPWIALWALYLSIVNVGQTFYSFGWETLLPAAGVPPGFLRPSPPPP